MVDKNVMGFTGILLASVEDRKWMFIVGLILVLCMIGIVVMWVVVASLLDLSTLGRISLFL